jgi:hypothetical protein
LDGLTEQDLQDDRPEVSLSSGWEVSCLPYKIRCLSRVSFSRHFGAEETYNRLHDICEVVARCDKQRSLLRISRADLVDPAQDEWTSAELGNQVSDPFRSRGRQTYAKLTEPINNFTTVDILVQRHLKHKNAENELCRQAGLVSE